MKFSVKVKTQAGVEETRIIEAANRFAVYGAVESQGVAVLAITEAKTPSSPFFSLALGNRIRADDRITFTKNLASMLHAGLTLSRALSVIERQSENRALKAVVAALEARTNAGGALHEALAAHPRIFSELYVAMVKSGEESGTLAESLRVVAHQMETSRMLEKKVKGAMIYPSIILVAIVVIAILMLIYVVPTLSATFLSFGVELPLATRIVIALSSALTAHLPLTLGTLIVLVGGGYAFIRSRAGRATVLQVALMLPVVGELVRETMSARAARSLASLLSSGVEMLTALQIAGEVVGKNRFGRVLLEASERVRKGETLSATFNAYPKLFPLFMADMITVGEETGKVADMLEQVALYYETDVEDRTKDLSTIIEPVLMLFIGVVVGVFAVTMIAPIYSLSSQI